MTRRYGKHSGLQLAPRSGYKITSGMPTKRKAQKHLSAKSKRRQQRRLREAANGGWR